MIMILWIRFVFNVITKFGASMLMSKRHLVEQKWPPRLVAAAAVVVAVGVAKESDEGHEVETKGAATGEAVEVVVVVVTGTTVGIRVVMVEVIKEVGEVTAHGKTRTKVKVVAGVDKVARAATTAVVTGATITSAEVTNKVTVVVLLGTISTPGDDRHPTARWAAVTPGAVAAAVVMATKAAMAVVLSEAAIWAEVVVAVGDTKNSD